MSNEVSVKETFENAITDRIREDFGKLMPDEALKEIIDKAVHNVFFHKKKIDHGYNSKWEEHSWLEQIVKDRLERRIDEFIAEFLNNNKEFVEETMKTVINNNLPNLLADNLINRSRTVGRDLGNAITAEFAMAIQLRQM